MDEHDDIEGRVTVEPLRFTAVVLSKERPVYGESSLDVVSGAFVTSMETALTANVVEDQVMEFGEASLVPIDRWEMLKAAVLPAWLQRFFPVKCRRIVEIRRLVRVCPHTVVDWQGHPKRCLEWLKSGKIFVDGDEA